MRSNLSVMTIVLAGLPHVQGLDPDPILGSAPESEPFATDTSNTATVPTSRAIKAAGVTTFAMSGGIDDDGPALPPAPGKRSVPPWAKKRRRR